MTSGFTRDAAPSPRPDPSGAITARLRPTGADPAAWLRSASLRTGPPGAGDVLIVSAVLLILGALVMTSHVVHGNFSYDDWKLSADVKYQGFWSTVNFYLHVDHRPLVALYLPLVQVVFGDHAHLQLAWIALAHIGMCLCLFVFLRTAGIDMLSSTVIAVLALVFPFANAGWLYVIGSAGTIAVSLYLLGSTAALAGLRASGRRAAWLHALAVALYVASVLTYELAWIAIFLSGLLYLTATPWRRAVRRWAVDIGAMVVTVLLATSRAVPVLPGGDVHQILTLSQQISHLRLIVLQARVIVAATVLPFGPVHYTLVLGAVALVLAIALIVLVQLPSHDPARAQLKRWLLVAGLSIVGVGVAWLVFAPADPYYSPGTMGVGNRINTFAGVCLCVFVYAVAMVAATLVFRGIPGWRAWAVGGAVILAGITAAGYLHRTNVDKAAWALAARLQSNELATIRRAVPHPPPEARVFLFGAPGYVALGVPVFAAPWDLDGAIELLWHDGSASADPILAGSQLVCGTQSVAPVGADPSEIAPYGLGFFIDARSGAVLQIGNRTQCLRALRQFDPGPLYL